MASGTASSQYRISLGRLSRATVYRAVTMKKELPFSMVRVAISQATTHRKSTCHIVSYTGMAPTYANLTWTRKTII